MDYATPQAPPLGSCAVFLDIDGTLLDIAATPSAVSVSPQLHRLLHGLSARLSGALALISGRSLADIERLFGSGLAAAAEHGALLRDAAGRIFEKLPGNEALAPLRGALQDAVRECPGTLLEEKEFGLVLHWRGAPEYALHLTRLAENLLPHHPRLMLQPAHEALEVRLRGPGKAAAMERFLHETPFAGRLPVFIGDDLTDEPAIARAQALGGLGLHVARDFAGSTGAVRGWLSALAARPDDGAGAVNG